MKSVHIWRNPRIKRELLEFPRENDRKMLIIYVQTFSNWALDLTNETQTKFVSFFCWNC